MLVGALEFQHHTVLLREAVETLRDFDQRWEAYSTEQNEPKVEPVMLRA